MIPPKIKTLWFVREGDRGRYLEGRHWPDEFALLAEAHGSGLIVLTGDLDEEMRPTWRASHCGRDAARLVVRLMNLGASRNPVPKRTLH